MNFAGKNFFSGELGEGIITEISGYVLNTIAVVNIRVQCWHVTAVIWFAPMESWVRKSSISNGFQSLYYYKFCIVSTVVKFICWCQKLPHSIDKFCVKSNAHSTQIVSCAFFLIAHNVDTHIIYNQEGWPLIKQNLNFQAHIVGPSFCTGVVIIVIHKGEQQVLPKVDLYTGWSTSENEVFVIVHWANK